MHSTAQREDRRPRYRQLADALIGDIRVGRIKVGATLPGEFDLGDRFGVSRHTVREALRVLDDLGLIARQQGIGTVVTARASTQPYVHAARSPADLLQYPLDSRLSVATTDDVRTDRRLARELGCPVGTRWRRIRTLRRARAGTPPLCWSDIYVRPEYAGVAEQIGRGTQPVYALLEATYGVRIAEVHVEIRAGLISDLLGAGLEAAPGTPSLDVLRRYTSVDKVIFEISLSVHPADRFAFSLDMRRGWQSGHGWTTV